MLTSGLETNSSNHSNERSKQHHLRSNSLLDLHSPKALHYHFRKQHRHAFCLLSQEACWYAGADWLSSFVSQRVATGRYHMVVRSTGRGKKDRQSLKKKTLSFSSTSFWNYSYLSSQKIMQFNHQLLNIPLHAGMQIIAECSDFETSWLLFLYLYIHIPSHSYVFLRSPLCPP